MNDSRIGIVKIPLWLVWKKQHEILFHKKHKFNDFFLLGHDINNIRKLRAFCSISNKTANLSWNTVGKAKFFKSMDYWEEGE